MNKGELDIRLVALMGGSTKSKDQYKIGQFGTGLKYTLAFLFRNNLAFRIYVGTNEVKVHTEIELIAGEEFEIICINNNRTSITTRMGEDWEPWMIVRELWCNALDEGEAFKDTTNVLEGKEGCTTFYIQEDTQIREVLNNWNKYFNHSANILFETNEYKVYPAGDHMCIYKQGVLVYEDLLKTCLFCYDFKSAPINELREFKGSISSVIFYSLVNAPKEIIDYVLSNITDDHYEATMDWDWFTKFGSGWIEAIGEAKIITRDILNKLLGRNPQMDTAGMIVLPRQLYKSLTKEMPHISAVMIAKNNDVFFEEYTTESERMVTKALSILETAGYPIDPTIDFRYGHFEDKRTLATINREKKIIMVSLALLQKPLFDVVAMLIEEYEHYSTGFSDHTREFQQHFIDLYTRQLLAAASIEV